MERASHKGHAAGDYASHYWIAAPCIFARIRKRLGEGHTDTCAGCCCHPNEKGSKRIMGGKGGCKYRGKRRN